METEWETNSITLTEKRQNSSRTGKHNKDTDKRNLRNIFVLKKKGKKKEKYIYINQTPLIPPIRKYLKKVLYQRMLKK